jgi:anti-sigma regulatory factor (Ser/Thr protein kinase)
VDRSPRDQGLRASTPTDIATITARNRLPGDVSSELVAALAHEPHVVVCDLTGMAPATSPRKIFEPVAAYLSLWPGTVVVVVVPETGANPSLTSLGANGRLLLRTDPEAGVAEARSLTRETDRRQLQLMPLPTAPSEARTFATRTLLDWQASRSIRTTSLVVSELVTASLLHAQTVIDLALSHAGSCLRVAVHDRGGGRPRPRHGDWEDETPTGRGMVLVDRLTSCWGVFPGRRGGKTVWALLDAAETAAPSVSTRP